MTTLSIRGFAHLAEVNLPLANLTVLVGAQGSGKSLALQWLKAAFDGKQIVSALRDAGHEITDSNVIDLIFGVGMQSAWSSETHVFMDNKEISKASINRRGTGGEKVFYIPAHRSLLMSDGWAMPFQKLNADTPVVARLFSQNLFELFSPAGKGEKLFPRDRVLKKQYRNLIDRAVFHGGTVALEEEAGHAKRLKLAHGEAKLPFMTWTAGQREFTPLLLGLYHLLPSRKILKREGIDWVIIEEPEMGLHPQAVTVFMLLCLDLLWRGYRVVLATHSPLVLTVAWMLRRLREEGAAWQRVCDGFGIEKDGRTELTKVAEAALKKKVAVHHLAFGADGRVHSKDISSLDPGSDDDDVSGWGGLAGFSSRFADAVRSAVNDA